MALTSKITPFLWFPHPQALSAAEFYIALFNSSPSASGSKPSEINRTTTYTQATVDRVKSSNPPAGALMSVEFTLAGQNFTALNGPYMPENPQNTLFPFNESVSFVIACEDQAEVDYFWENILKDGGKAIECGWIVDKFGVRWQVIPKRFRELADGAGEKADEVKERVTEAMHKMVKFDIEALEKAAKEALDGK